MKRLSMIPGPYRVQQEDDGSYSVYQPNGTIVANAALHENAVKAMGALNSCAILPVLKEVED